MERRPPGHPLHRALDLILGSKKVDRPCFTYPSTLAEGLGRIPPLPKGWPALSLDKTALAQYLRATLSFEGSSDEDEEQPELEWIRPESDGDVDFPNEV